MWPRLGSRDLSGGLRSTAGGHALRGADPDQDRPTPREAGHPTHQAGLQPRGLGPRRGPAIRGAPARGRTVEGPSRSGRLVCYRSPALYPTGCPLH